MNKVKRIFLSLFIFLIVSTIKITFSFANNLVISNVELGQRNPASDTIAISFDVEWENSWKSKINHDAVWATIRLSNVAQTPAQSQLCQLKTAGLNPQGISAAEGSGVEFFVPSDINGVLIRPSQYGVFAQQSIGSLSVTVDYASCGFSDDDQIKASVIGVEMVLIPEGAFYAGDYASSTAALVQGSADQDPWYITKDDPIAVSNAVSDGYRYVSSGHDGENNSGDSFLISEEFPKGYRGFYVMKYELSEGLWVDFVNSTSSAARVNRDLTDTDHKNSDLVKYRNTIRCSGSPLMCVTDRPFRPASYISWMDFCALLDWLALRPMTELEFEKMSRGPQLASEGEFAWGTGDIVAAALISDGDETGEEVVLTAGANAVYGDVSFSGGDSLNGSEYQKGPLRNGVFAGVDTTRISSGSTYYGVMDVSGNLAEMVVTVGNPYGRAFAGSHGDGILSAVPGFEGNATNSDWPGIDAIAQRGVTGATGSGYKGGSWASLSSKLQISDRSDAANAAMTPLNTAGGRGVRSYEE